MYIYFVIIIYKISTQVFIHVQSLSILTIPYFSTIATRFRHFCFTPVSNISCETNEFPFVEIRITTSKVTSTGLVQEAT